MKQKLLLFITALMLCIGARAEETTIGILTYTIYTDENYAEVTGIDRSHYYTEVTIPATIEWQEKEYPVTSLGKDCFSDCSKLTSATIPSSVTNIGDGCF